MYTSIRLFAILVIVASSVYPSLSTPIACVLVPLRVPTRLISIRGNRSNPDYVPRDSSLVTRDDVSYCESKGQGCHIEEVFDGFFYQPVCTC